jgi:hypothetical protein
VPLSRQIDDVKTINTLKTANMNSAERFTTWRFDGMAARHASFCIVNMEVTCDFW